MAFKPLTIGISTSALFDLREEHATYVEGGIDAYRRLQFERRRDPMKPGTAFQVVEKLLSINAPGEKPRVEIALISRNNIETGIRARAHPPDMRGGDVGDHRRRATPPRRIPRSKDHRP